MILKLIPDPTKPHPTRPNPTCPHAPPAPDATIGTRADISLPYMGQSPEFISPQPLPPKGKGLGGKASPWDTIPYKLRYLNEASLLQSSSGQIILCRI